MIDNPCLRLACRSDVFPDVKTISDLVKMDDEKQPVFLSLKILYDAEWRKRGFERSP